MPHAKKVTAPEAAPPPHPVACPAAATLGDIRLIDLDAIDDAGAHRQAKPDVEALAKSLADVGLLQPIGVVEMWAGKAARYLVLYGRRRVAAARALGWATIRATVHPAEVAKDPVAVRRLEAIENIERAALNPIEEVLAVSRLLETIAGRKAESWTDATPLQLQRAADLLGRTTAWVRDRAYLTRLCGTVQAMVADRRLPLAQAREIAKLASADEQTLLARWAVGREDWFGAKYSIMIQSVAHVRANVAARLSTLRGVPWEMGVAFAGRPACEGCVDNSAHATLFGIDAADETPEDRCLNVICHRAKMKAAESAVNRAVKDLKPVKDVAPTPAGVRAIRTLPDYVKPATVARRLAQARGIHPKAAAAVPREPDLPYAERPEGKYGAAHEKWQTAVYELVGAPMMADSRLLACYLAARAGKTMHNHVMRWVQQPDARTRKVMEPVLKRVASATAADLDALASEVAPKALFAQDLDAPPLWMVLRLADVLFVALPREPALEDFRPKAPAETAAPAKTPARAKKGRARK